MKKTLDQSHDFYLDKNLTGAEMRNQAIKFYNFLAYWNETLGEYEAVRKTLQAALEQVKDKAKAMRASSAHERGFKAAIQDAYIKNYHETIVDYDGEAVCAADLQLRLNEIQEKEIEARSNVHVCETAVDICRSALSFDKQELQKLEGGHN